MKKNMMWHYFCFGASKSSASGKKLCALPLATSSRKMSVLPSTKHPKAAYRHSQHPPTQSIAPAAQSRAHTRTGAGCPSSDSALPHPRATPRGRNPQNAATPASGAHLGCGSGNVTQISLTSPFSK